MNVLSSQSEAIYLQRAAPWPKLRDLCMLMLYQGCRPEEVLALEITYIDFGQRNIAIVDGKLRLRQGEFGCDPNPKPYLLD
jgi:integrase